MWFSIVHWQHQCQPDVPHASHAIISMCQSVVWIWIQKPMTPTRSGQESDGVTSGTLLLLAHFCDFCCHAGSLDTLCIKHLSTAPLSLTGFTKIFQSLYSSSPINVYPPDAYMSLSCKWAVDACMIDKICQCLQGVHKFERLGLWRVWRNWDSWNFSNRALG